MKSRIVVFDVFGTLIQAPPQRRNPYLRLITDQARKKELRSAFLTRNVSIEVFAEELGLAHLVPVLRQELETELAGYRLFPDVEPCLREIRKRGIRIGICSNLAQAYGDVVRRLLPGMDAAILSYEAGYVKPEPAIYSKVCEALSCSPRDITFIGDSQRNDVNGPSAFGMHAYLINRRNGETLPNLLEKMSRRCK